MKFRVSQWLDTSNKDAHEFPIVFGIQANNGNGWQHVAENGKALLFDTGEAADSKIKELRKRYPANAPAETRRDSGVVLQPVVCNSEFKKGE